jgi:hypothetical protein
MLNCTGAIWIISPPASGLRRAGDLCARERRHVRVAIESVDAVRGALEKFQEALSRLPFFLHSLFCQNLLLP